MSFDGRGHRDGGVGDEDLLDAQERVSARVGSLNRDLIVRAAVVFIDEHGLGQLTMRRLGDVFGVEAMSLYRYVSGKEDLLGAVVDHLVADMNRDTLASLAPGGAPVQGWQDFLQRMAHEVRRVALAHPRAFPLVASRPPEAPWLRPPLRSLDWVETFLEELTRAGFSDRAAAAGYRAFTSFLLGHLLLDATARGAALTPLDAADAPTSSDRSKAMPSLDGHRLADYPTLRRMRGELSLDGAEPEFEEGLEELLNRMEGLRGKESRD